MKAINKRLFKIIQYENNVIGIVDKTKVCSYFIPGTERGLLIDTGNGIGNIREFIETFYYKPFDVELTHEHWDHCGGVHYFEEYYIHKEDAPLIAVEFDRIMRTKWFRLCTSILSVFGIKKQVKRKLNVHYIKEEDSFDLGDRVLKVIEVEGHTKGSIVLLDEKNKDLFVGDAFGEQTYIMFWNSSPLSVYVKSLQHLNTYYEQFENVYSAHGSYRIDKRILRENIELCEELIQNKKTGVPYHMFGQDCFLAVPYIDGTNERVDGKIGNVLYTNEQLK